MNFERKRLRDNARFQVFGHLSKVLVSYVLSYIISNAVIYNMQLVAQDKNVELFTGDIKTLGIIYLTLVLALLINMPLSFCAQRFYLIISRESPFQTIPLKRFFEPFATPALLLKGTLLLIVISILNTLGVFVLVLPVYLAFSAAVFYLSDNPEISVFEALKRSAKMMRGKKFFAFMTLLPLFGLNIAAWVFLSSLYFVYFFVSSILQVMIFVVLALIYDKNKKEL